MYRGIPFRMLSLEEVEEYLGSIREEYGSFADGIQRIYLVGADPFALSASRLLERVSLIRKYLPNIKVITMYARVDNIAHKSDADLENELRPDKILINTLSAFVGTRLDRAIKEGKFIQASERENLEEERDFLAALNLPDTYFWSLHPLDSVRIDGILREEKEEMIKTLDDAIDHADYCNIKRISRTGNL